MNSIDVETRVDRKVVFTEEKVEAYRKLCRLYEQKVGRISYEVEPGDGDDLQIKWIIWVSKFTDAFFQLLLDPSLREKARAVPELRVLVDLVEKSEAESSRNKNR